MLKVGDRVVGVCGGGRECGVVSEVDEADRWPIQVRYSDGCYGRYLLEEVRPIVNRTWTTTQEDIDCQGRY